MKTYIIPRKTPKTRHDIASPYHERMIRFRAGEHYAVVSASSDGDFYTTHRKEIGAIQAARKMKHYSTTIIDSTGNEYRIASDMLFPA